MTPESSSQTRVHTPSAGARTSSGSSREPNVIIATDGSSSNKSLPPNIDNQPTVISKDLPALLPLAMANLPPAEMGRLLLGEKLGHYELQEFVGGGGMGAVFRALDPMLNRVVAVKVLSKVQSDDEETVRRFKNEAQSAARLDHENISRVHYVGEERGWHYIVFEFIEGVNLRDLVQTKGPLPLGEALSYTLQVTDALAHASRRDVVHRDIKPSNVLITPEGRAKLVDMGLARLHQVEHPDHDLTASGVTLGTFDYISPEQARDPRHADVRSDLYSLGCTLYFMLTGRPPFPDGTVLQKLLQHQADEPPDPKTLRPDLTDDVTRMLRKMLAKSPQQRYQQPDDLAKDLMAMALSHGLTLPSPTAVQWVAPEDRKPPTIMRHLPWLVPVTVLALVALALAIRGPSTIGTAEPAPIRRLAPPADTPSPARTTSAAVLQPDARNAARDTNPLNFTPNVNTSARSVTADLPGKISGINSAESPAGINSSRTVPVPAAEKSSASSIQRDPQSAKLSGAAGATQTHVDSAPPGTDGVAQSKPAPNDDRVPSFGEEASTVSKSVHDILSGLQQELRPLISGAPGDAATPKVPSSSADSPAKSSPADSAKSTVPNSVSAIPAGEAPSAGTSDPSVATATTIPVVERKGLLVVSRETEHQTGTRDNVSATSEYGSVGDACRAAKSGDVIELRYNGRLDEQPLSISNLRLTIRGADGYAPIVGFLPREGDPWSQASAMLSLGGSQLTLVNVQVQLDVPQHVAADRWTLAEVRPGDSLRLESATLTIRNATDSGAAFHPDVAIFEIGAVPGSGVMTPPDAPMMRPPASVQLKNCIVRGEATIVRSNQAQPFQLTWENGLVATSERFLLAGGVPSDPKPQGQIQIELRHVTALVRAGFCRLTNSLDSPQQLPLEVTASDCIFICDPNSVLLDQLGSDDPEDFRRRVSWNGDRNFYERLTTFWRIGAAGSEVAVQMNLHDWQTFWGAKENQPLMGQVIWQAFPAAGSPVSTFVPADFALRTGENPARNAASDGRDAGFQVDSLPILSSSVKSALKGEVRSETIADPKFDTKISVEAKPPTPARAAKQADANTNVRPDLNSGADSDAKADLKNGINASVPPASLK